MVTESKPPPPDNSGKKYGIIGLLLILAAGVIWIVASRGGEEPKPVAKVTPPADVGPKRSTALAEPVLDIPEPEVDAGQPEVKTKIVYRYVNEGGSWACSGEIAATKARAVIAGHRRQVRNCYERRLKVNNTLQGKVSLELKIGAKGDVAGVRVGGSLRDKEVFSCVRNLASKWTFPAPSGGKCAVVSAPFDFSPRSP